MLDQVAADRLGAALGQIEVVGRIAPAVRVAFDADVGDLGVGLHRRGDLTEQPEADRLDRVLVVVEVDLLQDLDAAGRQLDLGDTLVRAAVLIFDAVDGLGLERTLVVHVEDAVLVVVRLGAAVLVLEAVLVLGVVGALVGRVEHAVRVVVRIRAAVLVLEVVLVFRVVGALVDVVHQAVAVRVTGVRAAVLILEAVLGLGLIGALVDLIDQAILVVVVVGAAVRVLEAVLVLRIGGALVGAVHQTVAVRVLLVGLPGDAAQEAQVGRAVRGHDAHAAAERGHDAVVCVVAEAQLALDGFLVAAALDVLGRRGSEEFGQDLHLVPTRVHTDGGAVSELVAHLGALRLDRGGVGGIRAGVRVDPAVAEVHAQPEDVDHARFGDGLGVQRRRRRAHALLGRARGQADGHGQGEANAAVVPAPQDADLRRQADVAETDAVFLEVFDAFAAGIVDRDVRRDLQAIEEAHRRHDVGRRVALDDGLGDLVRLVVPHDHRVLAPVEPETGDELEVGRHIGAFHAHEIGRAGGRAKTLGVLCAGRTRQAECRATDEAQDKPLRFISDHQPVSFVCPSPHWPSGGASVRSVSLA